jgi:hypothetical protein
MEIFKSYERDKSILTIRKLKPYLKLTPYLILFGAVLILSVYFFKKKTITNEKRCDSEITSICWGYSVETYAPRNLTTFNIWHSWRVNQSFSFARYGTTPKVVEQRWLANGTTFYLYVDNINTDNSYHQNQKMRVIYDFENGKMYAEKYSAHWLNATLDSRRNQNLDLSEAEFNQILSDLDKATP